MEHKNPDFDAFFEGKTVCCFTGHRPKGLPAVNSPDGIALSRQLYAAIYAAARQGVTTFLAGGAMGFDTLAAEAVLALKDEGFPVMLVLALPAENQAKRWSEKDRERYERILARGDEIHYASLSSTPYAMLKRDRYLAEHADCCLCYLNALSGGTFYTVSRALECGIPVFNLRSGDIITPLKQEE